MAQILSKRPQQNSFQVVHFTSPRRFDDGQPRAYQKLRLILQGLLPAECNNVRCLVFACYPPQKIDRDVVDSVASRPR